jgi:hypothetical protein
MTPVALNLGGGTNSVALAVEAVRRGLRIDVALFADTGGEWPETYGYLWGFAGWLERHGIPVVAVRATLHGVDTTLEEHSARHDRMPSKAYGRKSCSLRFKRDPIEKWIRARWPAGPVVRILGYDADEPQRARLTPDERWLWSYPLIDWRMGREECAESIMRAGLPLPGKSACFYCPSARPLEVNELADKHPALFARGLAMEAAARPTMRGRVKGLGSDFSWASVERSRRMQTALPLTREAADPCGCYEGARDADLAFTAGYCGQWAHDIEPGSGGEWPLWGAPSKPSAHQTSMFGGTP